MKTAILVTGRLKSTRLPKKVIKPIKGRPMIAHLFDRLRLAKIPEQIILCTSPLEEDQPLVEMAQYEGVDCFQGDPDDVLLRLTQACEYFGIDVAISCTADNPFVDPIYIDKLWEFHIENDNDYSKSDGLPFGTFAYALKFEAMKRSCQIKAVRDTEVWGGYFTETGVFKWGEMRVSDEAVRWPDLRLTVDTPEDFEFVSRIFDELYKPDQVFSLEEIVDLCRQRPDLVAINNHVQQKSALAIRVKNAY